MEDERSCYTCKYENNGELEQPCPGCYLVGLPHWVEKELEVVPCLCDECEDEITAKKYRAAILDIAETVTLADSTMNYDDDSNGYHSLRWLCERVTEIAQDAGVEPRTLKEIQDTKGIIPV